MSYFSFLMTFFYFFFFNNLFGAVRWAAGSRFRVWAVRFGSGRLLGFFFRRFVMIVRVIAHAYYHVWFRLSLFFILAFPLFCNPGQDFLVRLLTDLRLYHGILNFFYRSKFLQYWNPKLIILTPVEVQKPLLNLLVSVNEPVSFFCIFFIVIGVKPETLAFEIFFYWKSSMTYYEIKNWKHLVKQIIYVTFMSVFHALCVQYYNNSFSL